MARSEDIATTDFGQAVEQAAGVRVTGGAQHLGRRTGLGQPAGVQHGDAIGGAGHEPEVMADQHHRRSPGRPQAIEQLDDLGLQDGVERRHGLIGDEHGWVVGNGHGDEHSLPEAARQLVGVVVRTSSCAGNAHLGQQLGGPQPGRHPADPGVGPHGLSHLVAD